MSKNKKSKISNDKYLDFILVDFLIQIDKGVAAKDCRVRFTKEQLEDFLEDSKLIK
jgi:hypothetical protein